MTVKGENIVKAKWSIANLFNEKKDYLWECGDNIPEMRKRALKLLEDPRLTDKEAVFQAKQIFNKSSNNRFISVLMTYMTGIKVS